jgi:hypothetical protein
LGAVAAADFFSVLTEVEALVHPGAALVTRSISGHLTERMQHHYSTVNSNEQRQGIAKVIELTKAGANRLRLGERANRIGVIRQRALTRLMVAGCPEEEERLP